MGVNIQDGNSLKKFDIIYVIYIYIDNILFLYKK